MIQVLALIIVILVSFVFGLFVQQWTYGQITRRLAKAYSKKYNEEPNELMRARWEGSWAAYESLADEIQGKEKNNEADPPGRS